MPTPPLQSPAAATDLISFFKALPDCRMRRGIRFPQWWMLLVAILAILSGQGSLLGMERFAKRHRKYKFFLTGVIETAKRGIKTFDGILRLQRAMDERLESLGRRSKGAKQVLEQLFKRPVTDADQIAEIIGKSKVSAYKLMSDLEEAGILVQLPNGGRAKMYAFKAYLDLFNE